jgi:hypothetical protein
MTAGTNPIRAATRSERISAGVQSTAAHREILLALGWYYPQMHRGVARFARDHNWRCRA